MNGVAKRRENFEDLRERYSPEEAKAAIDGILAVYGETCRITFRKYDAEITDSYLVNDVSVRHRVCEIIARTGLTKRNYEDLSAEWQVHNVSYKAGFMKDHAKDVALDYGKDPRASVRLATGIFDKLDIE